MIGSDELGVSQASLAINKVLDMTNNPWIILFLFISKLVWITLKYLVKKFPQK